MTRNVLSRSKYFLLIVFIFFMVIIGFIKYHEFYHDDAFISLRYAHHFINGHGLVWNLGERVEGYTNFLFVVLVSFLGKLRIDLIPASRIIGILSFAGIMLLISLKIKKDSLPSGYHLSAFIPLLLTATCLPLIVWSLGGMEIIMYSFLCLAAVSLFSKKMDAGPSSGVLVGLIFSLAAMTRPDAVLFFLITLAFMTFNKSLRRRYRYYFSYLLSFALPFGLFSLWRYAYYGDIFPNTFYVKSGFSPQKLTTGIKYILGFLFNPPYFGIIILGCVGCLLFHRQISRQLVYLSSCCAVYSAYVVYIGGDHMPAFRFMVPIIPIISLWVYHSIRPLRQQTAFISLALCLFIFLQIVLPAEKTERAAVRDQAAFVGEIVGRFIRDNFPEGSTIALNTAGSTPYFAPDHFFIDMLGLNDRTIAKRKDYPRRLSWQKVPGHEKGDGKYVLSRKPDYIIIGPAHGETASNPWFLSDWEMANNPEFFKNYKLQVDSLDVSGVPGYKNYLVTYTGTLTFRYYKRNASNPPNKATADKQLLPGN